MHPDSKELIENDQEKVDILSNFFGSVYNKQSHDILSDSMAKDICYEMNLQEIDKNLTQQLLQDL